MSRVEANKDKALQEAVEMGMQLLSSSSPTYYFACLSQHRVADSLKCDHLRSSRW
jgi:hypothetical protein